MVLRGSNGGGKDPEFRILGYRLYTVSEDDGRSWQPTKPWTYTDGAAFYSPSSMSPLIRHGNGSYFWLGNISASYPRRNSPRYPFYVGRVDPHTMLLERDSLLRIDTSGNDEPRDMTLSSFFAREDRESGQLVLHLSRWMLPAWVGNAYIHHIDVE